MAFFYRHWHRNMKALAGFALLGLLPAGATADTLTDNLANASAGTEAAIGADWITASFGTGATAYDLNSVTLLLATPTPGLVELDIYSDGGLQPGSLVGSLTATDAITGSLSDITFTTNDITLSANSTYWAVLKAASGEYDWSWTADDSGAGIGFQDQWGESSDAGVTWFTYSGFPTQLSVEATAVPEPGAGALLLTGGLATTAGVGRGWARARLNRRRSQYENRGGMAA
jgi:hypothetical protein